MKTANNMFDEVIYPALLNKLGYAELYYTKSHSKTNWRNRLLISHRWYAWTALEE